MPFWQAATCARRSARFCVTLRTGMTCRCQQRAQRLFEEHAAVDDAHAVDEHAFLVDGLRIRGHRARRDAADVGVMAARGDEELRVRRRPGIPA